MRSGDPAGPRGADGSCCARESASRRWPTVPTRRSRNAPPSNISSAPWSGKRPPRAPSRLPPTRAGSTAAGPRSTATPPSARPRPDGPVGAPRPRRQAAPGHESHPVRPRCPVGPVHADVHAHRGSRDPLRRDQAALPRSRAGAVPQRPGPRAVSVPLLHDARKWADYEAANELTFWIDPAKVKVVTIQFSARGRRNRGCAARLILGLRSTASGSGRTPRAAASPRRPSSWA